MTNLVIRKYDGDDKYSYAIFYENDIKEFDRQIFHGQAIPIVSGLSRGEAILHRKTLQERKNNENI